jgi:nicotinate-nucleotide--dimethylbenzimidazole phosphoribosyltransferase
MTLSLPDLDMKAERAARRHQASLTKPPGATGRLEDLACELAAIQASPRPEARPAACIIFAADHPVMRHGVSPYPQSVTRAMLSNFASGGAAASVLALAHRIPLYVVDVGVEGPPDESPSSHVKLVRSIVADSSEGDIAIEDALSRDAYEAAKAAGQGAVLRAGQNLKLLILGEIGMGNTTLASAVAASLLPDVDPAVLVGRGTGADETMRKTKLEVTLAAKRRLGRLTCPEEALRRAGGRELAALYGAMAAAIEQRTAILVDGFIVTVVALALCQKYAGADRFMIFSHESEELGHRHVLARLGVTPLLKLGLRLGEASGALTAFPIVEQAVLLHQQMATFEEARVPDRI